MSSFGFGDSGSDSQSRGHTSRRIRDSDLSAMLDFVNCVGGEASIHNSWGLDDCIYFTECIVIPFDNRNCAFASKCHSKESCEDSELF